MLNVIMAKADKTLSNRKDITAEKQSASRVIAGLPMPGMEKGNLSKTCVPLLFSRILITIMAVQSRNAIFISDIHSLHTPAASITGIVNKKRRAV